MCLHNSMNKTTAELAERYHRADDTIAGFAPLDHVSAFVYPKFPVITDSRQVQLYRWGLIPGWARTAEEANEIRKMTSNAKAETLFVKPAFRQAIRSRRCIVPSTGWFEWRHERDKKIPYRIRIWGEEIFSIAGVYDIWYNPENGHPLQTFSIITTLANEVMSYIHNISRRMPAILSPAEEERWLDPDLSDDEVADLLRPCASEKLDAYLIGSAFPDKGFSRCREEPENVL